MNQPIDYYTRHFPPEHQSKALPSFHERLQDALMGNLPPERFLIVQTFDKYPRPKDKGKQNTNIRLQIKQIEYGKPIHTSNT